MKMTKVFTPFELPEIPGTPGLVKNGISFACGITSIAIGAVMACVIVGGLILGIVLSLSGG
jgi:hypothetical protein